MNWSKKFLLLGGGMVLLMVIGWLVFAPPREPTYQDRPLRVWLTELARLEHSPVEMRLSPLSQTRERVCHEAITHFGTNAVPFLILYIQYCPPAWSRSRNPVCRALREVPLLRGNVPEKLIRREGAVLACRTLGPSASNAVPALRQAQKRSTDASFKMQVIRALMAIETNRPPVINKELQEFWNKRNVA